MSPMSIRQAASVRENGGHPLPMAWPSLAAEGVYIRGGELTVIAGKPATGKSALALATALRMKVPTLYICADTAAWTMTVRAVAMISNVDQAIVEERLGRDLGFAEGAFQEASFIKWCFDSAPTLDDISDEVDAYEEVQGAYPACIVIDNLVDVSDGEDEWAAIRRTQKELKFLARDTGAAVIVLHHVSEAEGKGPVEEGVAPARSKILGKDTRLPALVLTIASEPGYIGVAVVKNRHGKSDPSGRTVHWLTFDGARMQIEELRQ